MFGVGEGSVEENGKIFRAWEESRDRRLFWKNFGKGTVSTEGSHRGFGM